MRHPYRRPHRTGWYGRYKTASGRWRTTKLPGKRSEAARTVNMRVGAVRTMLRWGVAEGLIQNSPLARWRPVRGPKKKVRRNLRDFKTAKLLEASTEPF